MKTIFVFLIALVYSLAYTQNIDQWRGKDRSGIYYETGLLEDWSVIKPQLTWHFDGLGKGYSSVIVHSDKIFVTGMEDSVGFIYCINNNGKLLWKKEYGVEWTVNFPGSRTTPAFDNDRLFLMSTPGLASCFNAVDGNLIWQKDLAKIYGVQDLQFGIAESPLIVDNKVIFSPGGTKGTIVALDKNTGENIWVNLTNGEKSAYCSPLLINHHGNKIIVTSIEKHIVGISTGDGKLLWSYPQTNAYNVHANTPLYDGENIYSFSGYGKGGTMLKLSEDGSSVTLGWENPSLDNQMGGVVLIDGYIYGSGHYKKQWQCMDAKTGIKKYELSELINGAIIYNDGLLYCYSEKSGMVSILKPTENKFEIKGTMKVELGTEQHWAHPVICNGILYIRHGSSLLAYNLKKQ
jgi:outer membrane protein assembly factor BamB